MIRKLLAVLLLAALPSWLSAAAEGKPFLERQAREAVIGRLVEAHGEAQAGRIRRGVHQVADRWWPEDGDAEAFERFCAERFVADSAGLERIFGRLQEAMEQVDGHLHEVRRELTSPLDLDTGPVQPLDELLGSVDLADHVQEDLYRSKAAFLLLLNFPVHTLSERLAEGPGWNREQWARSRMMDRFTLRIPAGVSQEATRAFTAAERYISDYNIRMDRLVDAAGKRPFPEGLRLVTHWGLRDELKSQYANPDGLARQRLILRVMERIVRQEIPADVIDNQDLLWSPTTNEVWRLDPDRSAPGKAVAAPAREPDTRYARLLAVYRAVRQADVYSPTAPTYIQRKFELDREIPEKEVEALLVSIVGSEEFRRLAAHIQERLGRPLEAFDIWYDGFKPRSGHSQEELDGLVAARYANVKTLQSELPQILERLGFSRERAAWLAARIEIDPARGAGHAMGPLRRQDRAHLRTRFGANGMDYKGYNIAVHELGHNVEQILSLYGIDYWWLAGVPNTAFTEALAFVFQDRDLELLGLASRDKDSRKWEALDTLWGSAEIGGVALVDMGVWRWMYEHPEATPAELRQATLVIAREVWNRYFAPVFGMKDQELLAVYSHMISYGLYLPDYPLGHVIAFQVADKLRQRKFGEEFERIARQGRVTPDAWMRGAVGQPISAEALLAEARKALE